MAKFHRFVDPTYTSAPSLGAPPAAVAFNGADYDRLNVTSGGVGAGGSAYADASKAAGPNAGSYMVAFGEESRSIHANRGFRALAENTDFLDDLMNRDLAVPVRTANATAPGPGALTSIALPLGTFVGNTGAYPLDMLFSVVNTDDQAIIDPTTGTEVVVSAIAGALVGDGFSAGVVTLTLTPGIPASQAYRVYYSSRSSLAAIPVDALTFIKIRGAEEVSADVEQIFRNMQASDGSIAWNATPTTSLYDAAAAGLNERATRATVTDLGTVPASHPAAAALDTPGSGAWYFKDGYGPGMTAYGAETRAMTGIYGPGDHMFGGAWNTAVEDAVAYAGASNRLGMTSGTVFFGNRRSLTTDQMKGSPGLFSHYHGAQVKQTAAQATAYTYLKYGDTVTLNGDQITLPVTSWFHAGGEGMFALYADILQIEWADGIHSCIITAFGSATTGTLRYLDGAVPGFPASTGTIRAWIRSVTYTTDGAQEYRRLASGAGTIYQNGSFHASLPANDSAATPVAALTDGYARYFARTNTLTDPALVWGGYSKTDKEYKTGGGLFGNGDILVNKLNVNNGIVVSNGDIDFDNSDYFSWTGVEFSLTGMLTGTWGAMDGAINEKALTSTSSAPTVDVLTNGSVVDWNLDAKAPGTYTMTFSNVEFNSGYAPPRLSVIVRYTDDGGSGNTPTAVAFAIAGYTNYATAGIFTLPVPAPLQEIYVVYTGIVLAGSNKVVWTRDIAY